MRISPAASFCNMQNHSYTTTDSELLPSAASNRTRLLRPSACLLALLCLPGFVHATEPSKGQLYAGSARIEFTPRPQEVPRPYSGVSDSLYVRAIYLSNGNDSALLMNADMGWLEPGVVDPALDEIARTLHVPSTHIVVSATHDHNSNNGTSRDSSVEALSTTQLFLSKVRSGLIEAAKEAKQNAQPARIGFGSGSLYLNVNRDAIDATSRKWAEQPNPNYPSDKTLAVIKVESLKGDLIGIYLNYAMHANLLFLNGLMSADFPGETARYLETNFHHQPVVIWTSGAAGDQDYLYMRPGLEVSDQRLTALAEARHITKNDAMAAAMFAGDPLLDSVQPDPIASAQSQNMVKTVGQLMGEETIRVLSTIQTMHSQVEIEGDETTVQCPGRKKGIHQPQMNTETEAGDPNDAVRIKTGALRIGDIAIGRVNAEIYNMIGQEAKQGSKYRNTMIVTLANGRSNSGYIPTDDAFGRQTFQVLSTRLKPGCAQKGIVESIDNIIDAF